MLTIPGRDSCILGMLEKDWRRTWVLNVSLREDKQYYMGFPGGCQCRRCRDSGLILGWGRSSGGAHGNSLQYSFLENPMDRGVWQATVLKVTRSPHDWNDLAYKQYYIGRGRKLMKCVWCTHGYKQTGNEAKRKREETFIVLSSVLGTLPTVILLK